MEEAFWQIIVLLSGALAGFGKALRDTVAHHFPVSVFAKITNPTTYRWFQSDWQNKPAHWFSPTWDAWHFGDFLTWASPPLCLAIVGGAGLSWTAAIYYFAGFAPYFLLFYKLILVQKNQIFMFFRN